MARYFTLRLYFHSPAARENMDTCSWNISSYHTLTHCICEPTNFYSHDICPWDYTAKNEVSQQHPGEKYSVTMAMACVSMEKSPWTNDSVQHFKHLKSNKLQALGLW
jgi:hypothetical protein